MNIPDVLATKISVTRLHNLGDYEHAKYEVTMVVSKPETTGDMLAKLDDILKRLKPVREPYNLALAERVFADGLKEEPEADEGDCFNISFEQAKAIVSEHRDKLAVRNHAISELNALGATLEGKL